jgi:SEC-C motif domain protein
MRSRYTAFALGDVAHLRARGTPTPGPATSTSARATLGRAHRGGHHRGGLLDQEGTVTFTARHLEPGADAPEELREASRFARVDGRWVYVGPTS